VEAARRKAEASIGAGPRDPVSRGRTRVVRLAPILALPLLFAAASARAFDANGVVLGASEADVHKVFPSAHCKPLEWKSAAAERRCDDAQVVLAGAPARITLYLKSDRVQAFDVRFDERDLARVVESLKARYGAPLAETHERIERRGGERSVVDVAASPLFGDADAAPDGVVIVLRDRSAERRLEQLEAERERFEAFGCAGQAPRIKPVPLEKMAARYA